MLSDEFRARLSQIAPLSATARPARRSLRRGSPVEVLPVPRPADSEPVPLPPGEVCTNASGEHLRYRRAITELWPAADAAIASHRARADNAAGIEPPARHGELSALAAVFPAGALFLDLETCGFAGSPVFLAGVVWHVDGVLSVDQYFARHYGEERAMLETLWQVVGEHQVLVTFNGKSFDWPTVRDRTARHRLHFGRQRDSTTSELVHCDLLHHARRRWKQYLPDCRLQTLERFLCRRVRHNDLPGALVPAAYHHFVRTGDDHQIGAILHHNALDLVTLVQLAGKLV